MDDLEDADSSNVWARQSPENEKQQIKNNNSNDHNDDGLWDDNDDDDDEDGDATADLNNDFTLAASTLSIKSDNDQQEVEPEPESMQAGPSQPRETLAKDLASFDDFDDDDDFGEPAGAGEGNNGDDDDDFGAFDEADQDADFGDAFTTSTSTQAEAGPSTSTSTESDPKKPELWLLDFEKIGTTREQIRPHIEALFSQVWPDWADYVSPDIPIPNGTDKENILVTDYNMKKYHEWVEKPPDFEPFDWKRSHIRRNMMQALGIPVNLDDIAPPKAMPNLVLPSIHTTPASPSKSKHPNSLSASAPASATSSISRSASPNRPSLPPIDIPKAKELSEYPESEMKFKTLAELEVLRKDLQEVAIQASTHLTALLEKKEILSGQSETYNAMIQDLVREAQKMRSPANAGKGSSVKRSNSTSSKTSTSASSVPRSSFFGGGSSSRPNSRPASPAPATGPALNVKTSVSKSSAATTSPAKEVRRSSLW